MHILIEALCKHSGDTNSILDKDFGSHWMKLLYLTRHLYALTKS